MLLNFTFLCILGVYQHWQSIWWCSLAWNICLAEGKTTVRIKYFERLFSQLHVLWCLHAPVTWKANKVYLDPWNALSYLLLLDKSVKYCVKQYWINLYGTPLTLQPIGRKKIKSAHLSRMAGDRSGFLIRAWLLKLFCKRLHRSLK